MENAHRITYQLTLDDYQALQKIGEKKTTPHDRWIVGSVVIFMILLVGLALWSGSHAPRPGYIRHTSRTPLFPTFLPPLAVAIIALPIFLFFMRQQKKQQAELLREIQDDVTAWLAPEGFFTEGNHGESRQRWDTLHDLVETPTHLFLFLTRNAAHIVPKSAFDSTEQADAFTRAAWGYWNAARESAPSG